MIKIYDQTKHKDTRHACTLYTLLLLIKFDFGVKIEDDLILKLVYYAERIGALSLTQGAYFAVIYPALLKFINLRYGIDLRLVTTSNLNFREQTTYALGLKQLSNLQQTLSLDDGEFSKEDVDRVLSDKRGSGHAFAYRLYNGVGTIFDPWKGIYYTLKQDTLRYAINKGLFYGTVRYLVPGDKFTTTLQTGLKRNLRKKRRETKDNTAFLSYEEFKEIKRNAKIYFGK